MTSKRLTKEDLRACLPGRQASSCLHTMRLPRQFYTGDDVVSISQALLGKVLCTDLDGGLTSGIIVETEAYQGPADKASHAFGGRHTTRTEVMYRKGGTAYIYLCYGIHHLFNVVTAQSGVPHAILIRAIEPLEGIDIMQIRRKMDKVSTRLTSGPGSLSTALGLHSRLSGQDMLEKESPFWIEDRGVVIPSKLIVKGPRVGVGYAGSWAKKPWRFRIKDNPWTSPAG